MLCEASETCRLLQPEGARGDKPTLSPSGSRVLAPSTCTWNNTISRSPPIANWLTVVTAVDVRLCWRQAVLNWPFRGGPSWQWMGEEKGGRERENKGKKSEYLDKFIEQICRQAPLFFSTSYCKFLPLQHTHTCTQTHLTAEIWRSWLPQVLPRSLVCFVRLSAHWKYLLLGSLKTGEGTQAAELVMPLQQVCAGLHWQIRLSSLS